MTYKTTTAISVFLAWIASSNAVVEINALDNLVEVVQGSGGTYSEGSIFLFEDAITDNGSPVGDVGVRIDSFVNGGEPRVGTDFHSGDNLKLEIGDDTADTDANPGVAYTLYMLNPGGTYNSLTDVENNLFTVTNASLTFYDIDPFGSPNGSVFAYDTLIVDPTEYDTATLYDTEFDYSTVGPSNPAPGDEMSLLVATSEPGNLVSYSASRDIEESSVDEDLRFAVTFGINSLQSFSFTWQAVDEDPGTTTDDDLVRLRGLLIDGSNPPDFVPEPAGFTALFALATLLGLTRRK